MQPKWFKQLIRVSPHDCTCIVEDATIAYRHWQNPGKPGLVFVHGHAAHSRWWDFIAPAFKQDYDIVAIDNSGSGNSDHRDQYSAVLFSEEIVSCINAAKLDSPIIVGHSFGGAMTRTTAYLHPQKLNAIVLIDSPLPSKKSSQTPMRIRTKRERFYDSLEQGKTRFRLRPPQPCKNSFILDYLAAHSLKSTPTGFKFKLDGAVFAKIISTKDLPSATDMVRNLTVPAGFIYGENSRFFPEAEVTSIKSIIDQKLIRVIPNAQHHVFLDQPLLFVKALKEILCRLNNWVDIK